MSAAQCLSLIFPARPLFQQQKGPVGNGKIVAFPSHSADACQHGRIRTTLVNQCATRHSEELHRDPCRSIPRSCHIPGPQHRREGLLHPSPHVDEPPYKAEIRQRRSSGCERQGRKQMTASLRLTVTMTPWVELWIFFNLLRTHCHLDVQ